MSPQVTILAPPLHGFPRVSGDEPANGYGEDYVREFSPREWG